MLIFLTSIKLGFSLIRILIYLLYFILSLFFVGFSVITHAESISSSLAQKKYLISLAPNITELVFEANAEDFLLGVSSYSNYPSQAVKLPVISDHKQLFIEKIITLSNHILKQNGKIYALAWQEGTPKSFESILKNHGITTIWLANKNPYQVIQNLHIIANSLNYTGNNLAYIINKTKELQNVLKNTQTIYKNSQVLTYFYPIWYQPIMTIIGDNYTDSLLQHCQLVNIFKHAKSAQINVEAILMQAPHILIKTYTKKNNYDDQENNQQKNPQLMQILQKNKQFIYSENNIEADLLIRPTARSIYALPNICKILRNVNTG